MFICLFVFLLVYIFVFYFNHLGTPTEIYPENFVKIQLDLAEIFSIHKCLNVFCLFVCLLTCLCFILIFLEHPQECTLKISWRSDLIWLRYIGSNNVYLFVCLFICLYICLFFVLIIVGHPQKVPLKILWRSDLIWLRY